MTVHCEGDCMIIEQLGEKQDFEAELSRQHFRHEHFVLHVVRPRRETSEWATQSYSVTVENVVTKRLRAYQGGLNKEWVWECARDLAAGFLGGPMRRG
jgi:hypothetical protein